MSATSTSGTDGVEPITRVDWAALVARYPLPSAAQSDRRRHPRRPVEGAVRLAFTLNTPPRPKTYLRTCSALEISDEGLTLRSNERVPLRHPLAIELSLSERDVILVGKVVHCTQTVGAYKLGVHLRFGDARRAVRTTAARARRRPGRC